MKALLVVMAAAATAVALVPAGAAQLDAGKPSGDRLQQAPRAVKTASRLDGRLAAVAASATSRGAAAALATARRSRLATQAGRIRVLVEGPSALTRKAIVGVGGSVESDADGLIEAMVPPEGLRGLARARGVGSVRSPHRMAALAVDSEGVAATGANAWHAAGATGAGSKVAVIDLGFGDYAARQAAGELPAGLITQDYCGGLGAPEPHGTAVAEIVHEMAPSAQLYLICINSLPDLKLAEDYAKANGITIVNHSVGWFNAGRGDGSGGPTTVDGIVADARANGILWVNAAGNEAQRHWNGSYSDPDANGVHNFAPGDEGNTLVVGQNQWLCADLKWDSWPLSNQDFDFYLVRSSDFVIVNGSEGFQTGSQPPIEGFCHFNSGPAQSFFLAIVNFAATTAPRFDLFVDIANALQYRNADGSLIEPASSPHAFAAGAICHQSDALEPYSSQGPTIDGRIKPDIAGQSAVTSGIYGAFSVCGASGFAGTSSSAPHAAGAAALWKGLDPLSSGDAIRGLLVADALDLGVAGLDSLFGAGKLRLPTAAPLAVTLPGAAGTVTKTAIGVAGTVNPRGVPTTYRWQYGLTTAYGSQTTEANAGTGRAAVPVSAVISSLAQDTDYHIRLVATNMFGTTVGDDIVIRTLAPQAPTVAYTTLHVGATRAEVAGTVNPNDSSTTYRWEWGPTIAYGSQSPDVVIPSGTVPVPVLATLTPLDELQTYHYRLVATSVDGTTNGADQTFTTVAALAPVVSTGAASSITPSSARVAGTIHPGGEPTAYYVEYGPTTAYGQRRPVPDASLGFSLGATAVAVDLMELSASTLYHYRFVATNSKGTTMGADAIFTTAAPPAPPDGGGGGGGGAGAPDLELTGRASVSTARTGDTILYVLDTKVKNHPQTWGGSNLVLTAQLPAGVELLMTRANRGSGCSGASTVVCPLDYLSSTLVATVEIVVRVAQQGDLVLNASVRSAEVDFDSSNNSISIRVTAPQVFTPPATPPSGGQTVNVVRGTSRGDVLGGTSGRDRMFGLGGNDSLFGRGGADELFGGSGKDRLVGGTGRDLLNGGLGADRIEARDGARDRIACGAGKDVVIVDRLDVVGRDCETIRRR